MGRKARVLKRKGSESLRLIGFLSVWLFAFGSSLAVHGFAGDTKPLPPESSDDSALALPSLEDLSPPPQAASTGTEDQGPATDEFTDVSPEDGTKISAVSMVGLRSAERQAIKIREQFAAIPGGTIRITH